MSLKEGDGAQGRAASSLMKLIAASVIFGTVGFFRKGIPLPSAALSCYRGLAGALFLFAWVRIQGGSPLRGVEKNTALKYLGTGAVMGLNWILLFEAYRFIPVSQATLCYYMQPSIVMLLSPLILKERMTGKTAACVLFSFVGMVLVSGILGSDPPRGEAVWGILMGLGAAGLYAAVIFLNKLLPGQNVYDKTLLQLLGAGGILLPYVLLNGQMDFSGFDFSAVLLLAAIGLVHTGLAYVLYFGSMDGLPARTIALVSYLDPVSALLLSALFFGETLTGGQLTGAFLILASAVAAEVRFPGRGAKAGTP